MRLILFLLALSAYGQIRPDQIKLTPSPLTTPAMATRIAAWDAAGSLTYLDIGPGITISGGKITATAASPPAVPVLVTTRMLRSSDGTYQAPTGIVARNGIIQRAGEDYTVVAGVLTPVKPWGDDEIILSISAALMVPTETKKP